MSQKVHEECRLQPFQPLFQYCQLDWFRLKHLTVSRKTELAKHGSILSKTELHIRQMLRICDNNITLSEHLINETLFWILVQLFGN